MANAQSEHGRTQPRAGGAALAEPERAEARGRGETPEETQMDGAKSAARERVAQVKDSAQEKGRELRETAERKVDAATSRSAGRVATIARALRTAGDELGREGEDGLAGLTRDAAAEVERFGSYLDAKDPTAMLHDLERKAKGNPALFAGSALAAGLALGRFLRSSAPEPDSTGAAGAGSGTTRAPELEPGNVPRAEPATAPSAGPEPTGSARPEPTRPGGPEPTRKASPQPTRPGGPETTRKAARPRATGPAQAGGEER